MSVFVFLGPTLARAEAARILDASFLPPVRAGDVYRLVSRFRASAVGIVDGYFQWAPPVWHKEILWAIGRGVHVFGAGSMGALRAAELAPFGMHGVGRVFEAYREGRLGPDKEPFEDDDEVAVVHGPQELSYVAASEAMVNIRCTLARAAEEGVIADATHRALVATAKATFFPERDYARLLAQGRVSGLPEGELAVLECWLPSGQINQKRLDALAMLEEMRDFLATDPPPAPFDHTFERTIYWDQAAAYWDRAEAVYAEGDESAKATLLVALRLRMAECKHFGEEEVAAWYFAHVARAEVPADLAGWARGAGYTDLGEFHRCAFAEYLRRAPDAGGRP